MFFHVACSSFLRWVFFAMDPPPAAFHKGFWDFWGSPICLWPLAFPHRNAFFVSACHLSMISSSSRRIVFGLGRSPYFHLRVDFRRFDICLPPNFLGCSECYCAVSFRINSILVFILLVICSSPLPRVTLCLFPLFRMRTS